MGGILFIDAEQPFADQMVGSLKNRGFSVKLLDDGKDGLDYARDGKPDLIVLCVELPKMSGYSICNKLKKDADLKGIPLIITSKEATPETFAQHKKLKTRAEDYLIKPFSEAELIDKVGTLIPLPAGGAAASSGDDGLDALESLGADLDLGPSGSGGSENDIKLDDVDFATLDNPSGKAPEGLGLSPEDDALLASLDDLGGSGAASSPPSAASSALDDLEFGASLGDSGLGDLDNLDSLTEAPPAAPPPKPAAAPKPESRTPAPATSMPPSAASSSADLAALAQLRRDNSDLKGKVAELEARVRAADESARAKDQQIAAAAAGGGGASSAREVLNLKEQLRTKEKEIGQLKDDVFEKEKANVDLQEQIERVRAEAQVKLDAANKKDAEISGLQAKLNSVSEERDQLEEQVQGRLAQAEAERDQLRAEVEMARADVSKARNDLDRAKAFEDKLKSDLESEKKKVQQLEARVKEKEGEAQSAEDRALKAFQRVKTEEAVREKAKKAVEIAFTLLSGDVDTSKKSALDLELDAE